MTKLAQMKKMCVSIVSKAVKSKRKKTLRCFKKPLLSDLTMKKRTEKNTSCWMVWNLREMRFQTFSWKQWQSSQQREWLSCKIWKQHLLIPSCLHNASDICVDTWSHFIVWNEYAPAWFETGNWLTSDDYREILATKIREWGQNNNSFCTYACFCKTELMHSLMHLT